MRQGSNGRRPRGRPQRKQHGAAPRHGNFDSSGPEGRIRGNAHQVYEKYIGLARDATSMGDRIAAETYYQYAEHYYRIVNVRTDPKPDGDGQSGRRGGNGHAEAAVEAAPQVAEEQPVPAPINGEQPQEAPPAQVVEDRPAPQRRRRARPAKTAAPQPDHKPEAKPEPQPEAQPKAQPKAKPGPEAQANDNGEPVET
jgi:hypothetical protein